MHNNCIAKKIDLSSFIGYYLERIVISEGKVYSRGVTSKIIG